MLDTLLRAAWLTGLAAPRKMLKCEQEILCVSCEYLSELQLLFCIHDEMTCHPNWSERVNLKMCRINFPYNAANEVTYARQHCLQRRLKMAEHFELSMLAPQERRRKMARMRCLLLIATRRFQEKASSFLPTRTDP
jgi:hypothetical protein